MKIKKLFGLKVICLEKLFWWLPFGFIIISKDGDLRFLKTKLSYKEVQLAAMSELHDIYFLFKLKYHGLYLSLWINLELWKRTNLMFILSCYLGVEWAEDMFLEMDKSIKYNFHLQEELVLTCAFIHLLTTST